MSIAAVLLASSLSLIPSARADQGQPTTSEPVEVVRETAPPSTVPDDARARPSKRELRALLIIQQQQRGAGYGR